MSRRTNYGQPDVDELQGRFTALELAGLRKFADMTAKLADPANVIDFDAGETVDTHPEKSFSFDTRNPEDAAMLDAVSNSKHKCNDHEFAALIAELRTPPAAPAPEAQVVRLSRAYDARRERKWGIQDGNHTR